jgi:hypothetical protein
MEEGQQGCRAGHRGSKGRKRERPVGLPEEFTVFPEDRWFKQTVTGNCSLLSSSNALPDVRS